MGSNLGAGNIFLPFIKLHKTDLYLFIHNNQSVEKCQLVVELPGTGQLKDQNSQKNGDCSGLSTSLTAFDKSDSFSKAQTKMSCEWLRVEGNREGINK